MKSFCLLFILFCAAPVFGQDASTPEGQKSIEHRNRFYLGNPIKKFSQKITRLKTNGVRFSNTSPAIYDGVAYIGTDSGAIYSATVSEMKNLCKLNNAGAIEGA